MGRVAAKFSRRQRLAAGTPARLASAVFVLLWVVGPASAGMPTIGPPVAELTSLAKDAVHLLDAHLSPAVSIEYEIGWENDAVGGDTTPADTNPNTRTTKDHLTGTTERIKTCQIAVNENVFKSLTAGNTELATLEIITHEMFHCYELQFEGDAYATVGSDTEKWLQEGTRALGRTSSSSRRPGSAGRSTR